MEEWLAVDPGGLSDAELGQRLVAFERVRARFDAAELRTAAEWERRRAWAADGALSGAAWLQAHAGMAGATARERLRVARRLRSMPAVAEAFDAGALTYAKVRLVASAVTPATAGVFARDESRLVGWARRFGPDDLARLVAHWKACADPDGCSADAAARWTRRQAGLVRTFGGAWALSGVLDAESGAIVKTALDGIVDELWHAERRDAACAGSFPGPAVDATGAGARSAGRTAGQRRADALVETARRAAACDIGTARRSRPELVVVVDHDTLVAATGGAARVQGGPRLTGDAARRLACDAGVVRAVTNGPSEVLDLGRSTPTPNAAQRRALAIRDGGLRVPDL